MALRTRLLTGLLMILVAGHPFSESHGKVICEGFLEGDIIFQETRGPLADFLKDSTGSRFTHAGMVRETASGIYVYEVTPGGIVFETPIEDFQERGVDRHYSVYRFDGLEPRSGYNHPAILAAYEYYRRLHDPFYRMDKSALYSSELVRHAFNDLGVELGTLQLLGDLGADTSKKRAVFLSDGQDHPECKNFGLDAQSCWKIVEEQEFVTPASIANDPKLRLVFTSSDELSCK